MTLPVISADLCLLARFAVSTCSACITACPHAALTMGDEGLDLTAAACTACGACAAACPSMAIALNGTEAPAPLDRPGTVAWLACPRHPKAMGKGLCLHSLGLPALARLWLGGLRVLHVATADCRVCPDGRGVDLPATVAALNQVLASRGFELLTATNTAPPPNAAQIGPAEVPRQPSRRSLFGLRRAAIDPRPLATLQAMNVHAAALYATVPRIDVASCSGCDACIKLCPENSLSLIKAENGDLRYGVDPTSCNACGICADMCGSDAIRFDQFSPAPTPLALTEFRCSGCGVSVHVPMEGPFAAGGLCPTCRHTGHHKRLFQVLA